MDYLATLRDCLDRLQAKHGLCKIAVTFPMAVVIISHVQLALRHPANQGDSAKQVRGWLDTLIRAMEASEPRIGPLLRMGFDAVYDVPREAGGS